MDTPKKEYLLLFNTLTDAEEALRQLCNDLISAQQRAEELFWMSRRNGCPQLITPEPRTENT